MNTGRTRFKKGMIPWNKGKKWSEKMIQKLSKSHKGNKAHLGKLHKEETKLKISQKVKKLWKNKEYQNKTRKNHKGYKLTEKHKKKISIAHEQGLLKSPPVRRGKENHLWKGGITPINMQIRSSLGYKLWIDAVFTRDNYTCVGCGNKSSKNNPVILQADHIKPFAYFKELRLDVDNGRTLCIPCHKKTDTYMGKAKSFFKQIE